MSPADHAAPAAQAAVRRVGLAHPRQLSLACAASRATVVHLAFVLLAAAPGVSLDSQQPRPSLVAVAQAGQISAEHVLWLLSLRPKQHLLGTRSAPSRAPVP